MSRAPFSPVLSYLGLKSGINMFLIRFIYIFFENGQLNIHSAAIFIP